MCALSEVLCCGGYIRLLNLFLNYDGVYDIWTKQNAMSCFIFHYRVSVSDVIRPDLQTFNNLFFITNINDYLDF